MTRRGRSTPAGDQRMVPSQPCGRQRPGTRETPTRSRASRRRHEQQAQRLLESQRLEAEATLDGARLRADAELKAAQKQRNDAHAPLAQTHHEARPAARRSADRTRHHTRPHPARGNSNRPRPRRARSGSSDHLPSPHRAGPANQTTGTPSGATCTALPRPPRLKPGRQRPSIDAGDAHRSCPALCPRTDNTAPGRIASSSSSEAAALRLLSAAGRAVR